MERGGPELGGLDLGDAGEQLVVLQGVAVTFTREQLVERLHGVAYEGYNRSVDSHIKNLRRKLEANPVEPRTILTVYGIGYRFNDEVDLETSE